MSEPASNEDLVTWAKLYEHARELRGDELRVLTRIAERLAMGRRQYGALDITKDPRDWTEQALEEALDGTVYLSIAMLQKR